MKNKEAFGDKHGFAKSRSCGTNLMAFYIGVVVLIDKGGVTDIISLNLCKAFDTVPRDSLVSKLERHGFDRWTTRWIRKLADCSHSRSCFQGLPGQAETCGNWSSLILGLVLFNLFVSDMDSWIKDTLGKFANDCVLQLSHWRGGKDPQGP